MVRKKVIPSSIRETIYELESNGEYEYIVDGFVVEEDGIIVKFTAKFDKNLTGEINADDIKENNYFSRKNAHFKLAKDKNVPVYIVDTIEERDALTAIEESSIVYVMDDKSSDYDGGIYTYEDEVFVKVYEWNYGVSTEGEMIEKIKNKLYREYSSIPRNISQVFEEYGNELVEKDSLEILCFEDDENFIVCFKTKKILNNKNILIRPGKIYHDGVFVGYGISEAKYIKDSEALYIIKEHYKKECKKKEYYKNAYLGLDSILRDSRD